MNTAIQLLAAMSLQSGASQHGADPRIQTHSYSSGTVINLAVSAGYAAVIELSRDEQIDAVVVGNGAVWQITETGSGNRLVVKPLAGAVPTNMVVMTDARRYVFQLDSAGNPDQTSYIVRFDYSEGETPTSGSASATYKFKGDRSLFPVSMRDDGRRTRVRWAKQTPLPAIVAAGEGRAEALVNGRMVGNEYVIEGTAARYKFRYGKEEAVAVRKPARRSGK